MNSVPLFLIIVTLPLLLGGCGEKDKKVEKEITVYQPELDFRYENNSETAYIKGSDIPYTGKFTVYTYDMKSSEGNYKEGKKDGTIVHWHPNGTKWMEEMWVYGEKISENH